MENPSWRLSVQADVYQNMLVAKGVVSPEGGLRTLVLESQDAKVRLHLPPERYPFIGNGDLIAVTIGLVKPSVQPAPPPPIEGLVR